MDPCSLFLALPTPIMNMVVEYLQGHSRGSFKPGTKDHAASKAALAPLMLVSERWRLAALESICDSCTLNFDYSRRAVEVFYPALPSDFSLYSLRKNHLVKKLVITAKLWKDMCDGTFCKTIRMPQYECLSFPSATTLEFELSAASTPTRRLSSNSSTPASLTSTVSHGQVAGFARSLLHITPSVRKMILLFGSASNLEPSAPSLYNTLASELCKGGVHEVTVASKLAGVTVELSLASMSGLTHISQVSGIYSASFAKLAYLNAATLQSLKIRLARRTTWHELIYGGIEKPAAYTSLTALSLSLVDIPHNRFWRAVESEVPFPALIKLDICGAYPFRDDLLFKGNSGSMLYLRVPLNMLTASASSSLGFLEGNGQTKLLHFCIGAATKGLTLFADDARRAVERRLHFILGVARTLTIMPGISVFDYRATILSAPNTTTLQHLHYENLKGTPKVIIELIYVLPNLESLVCGRVDNWSDTNTPTANRRLEYLRAEHYPLSKKFKFLRVLYTKFMLAKDLAYVASMLAVLCPNFMYVDIAPELRNEYSREIAWTMANMPFAPYADSLRRLIYKEDCE